MVLGAEKIKGGTEKGAAIIKREAAFLAAEAKRKIEGMTEEQSKKLLNRCFIVVQHQLKNVYGCIPQERIQCSIVG